MDCCLIPDKDSCDWDWKYRCLVALLPYGVVVLWWCVLVLWCCDDEGLFDDTTNFNNNANLFLLEVPKSQSRVQGAHTCHENIIMMT